MVLAVSAAWRVKLVLGVVFEGIQLKGYRGYGWCIGEFKNEQGFPVVSNVENQQKTLRLKSCVAGLGFCALDSCKIRS